MNKFAQPILELHHVSFSYKNNWLQPVHKVLDNVTFSIPEGCIFGITGFEGSGKTTLASIMVGLNQEYTGSITFQGKIIDHKQISKKNSAIRMPYLSHTTINFNFSLLQELSLLLQKNDPHQEQEIIEQRIINLLESLSFPVASYNTPQIQLNPYLTALASMARALILRPKVLILDEFLTVIDISLRFHFINYLLEYRKKHNITLVMFSGDLRLLKHLADYLLILHQGKIVEQGSTYEVLTNPQSDFTQRTIEVFFKHKLDFTNWSYQI